MSDTAAFRIVILDDDDADAELVERELRRAGMDGGCERVSSEEGFVAALWPPPDLVLADYRLPGFSALAALRLLRRRGLEVPVIVVTGSLGDEAAVECLREGATDYLLKDRLGRLAQAASNAIEQARLRLDQRRREQLLQAVVDGAATAIFVKDTAGRFLLVNRRFEALLGKCRGEIVGRRDFELYPAEVVERFAAHERAALATRSSIEYEEEVEELGEARLYWSARFALLDLDGEPYALCGISTDITDRKRLEAQLRQSQKMEAVGQLAGGLAHDFNNLLTVILGYSQLLAGSLSARADLVAIVREIRKAGERAAALTHQLLAFSRNQILEPRLIDLNSVLMEVETMLRRMIGEDVELATHLRAHIGRVMVDATQVEQVIFNLAINARDAMPDGGQLVLETADVELDQAYVQHRPDARTGPHVMLAVSDTGSGMDAETRSHIFEPFFTTKEKGKGTGLGLSTVYGIVRQSGGHIEVYSEPGHGTTFRIYFPRVASESEGAGPVLAAPRAVPVAAETILLLEDDAAVRTLASAVLAEAGYTVLAEASAGGALSLAAGHSGAIDLVLTDVIMPGMSGPEVAARIVAARPAARVLYTSGYTGNVIDRKMLQPGAQFLEKPFTVERLLSKVRDVLDGAAHSRGGCR